MYNNLIRPEELKNIRVLTLQRGQTVCREGDAAGGTMFFVLEGTLGVYKTRGGAQVKLTETGKGEFFGELGLLSNNPRLATITTESETARIAVISRASFVDTMDINPVFLFQVFKHTLFQTMLARKKLKKTLDGMPNYPLEKLDFQMEFNRTFDIGEVVKNTNLDYHIAGPGELLYRTGDEVKRQAVSFIDYGRVRLSYRFGKKDLVLAELGPGTFFAEETLLEQVETPLIPCQQALEKTRTVNVDKALFLQIARVRPDFLYDILSETIRKLAAAEKVITRLFDEGAKG